MRVLGIDYGLARIGLAFSEGDIAEPIGIVKAESLREGIAKIINVINEKHVDTVVLGKTSGTMQAKVEKFAKDLSKEFTGPMHYVEESMTTKDAQRHLIVSQASKKKRQSSIDAIAAAVILQTYLDEQQA